MKKKLLVLGMIMSVGFMLSACSLFGGDDKKSGTDGVDIKKNETGGLYYTFEGKNYDACDYTIGDIVYQGPDFGNTLRTNTNAYSQISKKQMLFVWFDPSAKAKSSSTVVEDNSASIIKGIATDVEIKTGGVNFNLQRGESTTVNGIERTMQDGMITCHKESDDSETEYATVIYSFVVDGKPGAVIGVVTDPKQEATYKDEIKHNAEVLMNTIVKSK